jgi:hypothetical protein
MMVKGLRIADLGLGLFPFRIPHSAIRPALRGVQGCPEPKMVQGAFRNAVNCPAAEDSGA